MKKNLKTILLPAILLVTIFLVLASPALAIDITGKLENVGTNAGYEGQETTNLPVIIGGIIKGLLSLLGVIFTGYIIYAGYLWMTAKGEEEKLTKAKAIIKGSIIGIIIVLAAYGITTFVIDRLITATGYGSGESGGGPENWDNIAS